MDLGDGREFAYEKPVAAKGKSVPALHHFPRLVILVVASLSAAPASAGQSGTNYISYDDYPAQALSEGREGITHFRLVIGADGRVRSCEIARSSGHSDLDAATCRIMRSRARFRPARNDAGQAVESTFEQRMTWSIRG